jgi:hypothetical protein
VILTHRGWRQVLEKQSFLGMTVARKPVTGERAKQAVKIIAQEMPGVQ